MNYIERLENPEFESISPLDSREVFRIPEEEGGFQVEENPKHPNLKESHGGARKSPRAKMGAATAVRVE
jgi:hypothetical protein